MTKTTNNKEPKKEEKLPASAAKKASKHKVIVKSDEEASPAKASAPFKIGDLHTKALLKLLRCHHNGGQTLTYPELSAEIGIGEKTKRWQCEAWKDLKTNQYIIPASGNGGPARYQLSEKGIVLATTFASDEELEEFKMPETNEEHHEKIKARLARHDKGGKYGPKIFQFLVENKDTLMTRHEIADHFKVDADSHGFFYGLSAIQKMGMVAHEPGAKTKKSKKVEEEAGLEEPEPTSDGKKKKKKKSKGGKLLKLTEKAFLATAKD